MNDQQIALKLNDHDHEIKSLKHRVEEVEQKQSEIGELTQSVNKLAINMGHMLDEQKEQGERLKKLEAEPADNARYYKRTIISCVITTIIGGILGALIALLV